MSRKTKLAIDPPDRELDFDDENDQRHLMEQAFSEHDRHPKPTMAPPERSRWWWFWRAFGFFIHMPARKVLMSYLRNTYVPGVYGENPRPGYLQYEWPFAGAFANWIGRGWSPRGRSFRWLRKLLLWLCDVNRYDTCTWCGFTDYSSDYIVYDDPSGDGREINMSEFVDGGGVDYWGEGQDAYGWKWCYRCGAVDWDCL